MNLELIIMSVVEVLRLLRTKISNQTVGLKSEQCFNIGLDSVLTKEKLAVIRWLLAETYEPENMGTESFLNEDRKTGLSTMIIEIGPRLSFTTEWSANACR
ncbi:unnamed protein product [Ilex paraguariensis]|uniref:Uncharacterized protein n=1 Tax=Ilex paraguariensis TaxID=185542 RepID=A0ABC8QRE8_9AQUA